MTGFWKVTPLVALSATIVLLVAAIAIFVIAERSYRDQAIRKATVDAEILARAVAAPLAFADASSASLFLNAMEADRSIVAAAVYDEKGALFASFRRAGARPVPETAAPGSVAYNDARVSVSVAVDQRELSLGTVYLRVATDSFAQRFARYSGLVLLGLMMLVVLAVLGIAQATVNRANVELKRRAEELEEANARLLEQIVHRERAEEALRHAQKMESIGQLTGGVAHDFNNLLAIVLGNLERLDRRLVRSDATAPLREIVANARAGAERAARLTRSLLAFSRRQPLNSRPVDVERLIASMSVLLRSTLGEQIAVESSVEGGLWHTLIDPNQLENAILNLSVNARDAMPKGGRLTIRASNLRIDEREAEQYDDLKPGEYVRLSIADTGIGMSKKTLDRAFEPFFTTKDVGHGTGLGLSQVYGLVKQSGGHIAISSEPGKGTTVRMLLPRVQAERAAAPVRVAPAAVEVVPNPTAVPVLVVEDDNGVRAHSVALFAELGHSVFEAGDGAQALRVLDQHADIGLLFTDIGLPGGMNGRQLAEEARRRRPNLAVVYTTGYARDAIARDGRLDPDIQLVAKPFSYRDVAAAVKTVLDAAVARTVPLDRGCPSVLVVEDEYMIMLSTVEKLADLGCEAIEAGTASEAREVLRNEGDRLAAVIVDLNLPDLKGDGLVAEFRSTLPNVPVIVSSGLGADGIRQELAADPMVSVLPKPYSARHLEVALQQSGVLTGTRERA